MALELSLSDLLGLVYVCCWSVSIYPPILTNWRYGSANALSIDFVMLNTAGYFYLVISLILQLYWWMPLPKDVDVTEELASLKPKITNFDLCYCLHGVIMNLVLVSQVVAGHSLWRFKVNRPLRMEPIYYRVLALSILVFMVLTGQLCIYNLQSGWDNLRTLDYCNRLFLLKISMSLIKYVPQVFHNHARRSMKGFAIQSTVLDVTGGVSSLMQLVWQISKEQGFNTTVWVANFGKIGLALVTILFNIVFLLQWSLYSSQSNALMAIV